MTSKSELRKGAQLEADFTDLLANGQAVGRYSGQVLFCFGPLPGERARVRVTEVKQKYAVAALEELLTRGASRAEPFCPVFGTCGGCQVQHMSYEKQLEWKRTLVQNAMQRIGGFKECTVQPATGMRDPRAYRNKMALVIDPSHPRVGFYKQRSHDIVEIDGCPVVLPVLDREIPRLNALKSDGKTAALFAEVKHVIARSARAGGKPVLSFTTPRRSQNLPQLVQHLMPDIEGAENSYDLPSANAISGRKHTPVDGAQYIEETIGGIRYRVSSGSFFQINVEIVERIFEHMRRRFGTASKVMDFYCGAATFSLLFAKLGARVRGIDDHEGAVKEAKINAELNGMSQTAQFSAGRIEQIVNRGDIRRELEASELVFLDPPRKGSDERTLAAIAAASPQRIWYLSCDPATLARDLKFLTAKNYQIDEIMPFDMFPQTGHVETLVTLHG